MSQPHYIKTNVADDHIVYTGSLQPMPLKRLMDSCLMQRDQETSLLSKPPNKGKKMTTRIPINPDCLIIMRRLLCKNNRIYPLFFWDALNNVAQGFQRLMHSYYLSCSIHHGFKTRVKKNDTDYSDARKPNDKQYKGLSRLKETDEAAVQQKERCKALIDQGTKIKGDGWMNRVIMTLRQKSVALFNKESLYESYT